MEKKKKEEKYSNWRTKRRKPSPLFIQTEAEKFYCPTISHHYRRLSSKNFLHFRDIIYDNKVCLICVPTRKKKEKRKRNSRRRCFTFFSVRFFERNRHSQTVSPDTCHRKIHFRFSRLPNDRPGFLRVFFFFLLLLSLSLDRFAQ